LCDQGSVRCWSHNKQYQLELELELEPEILKFLHMDAALAPVLAPAKKMMRLLHRHWLRNNRIQVHDTPTNPGQTNPGRTNPGHDKPRVIVLGVRLKLRVRLDVGLG
jgi:hypothetical protein